MVMNGCEIESDKKEAPDYSSWENYAGTKDGSRYSSLEEIDLSNVRNLQVAWRYSSGDKDTLNRSQNQCNPIVVDGILYGSSPKLKLLALNAANGEPKWVFDPAEEDRSHAEDPYRFYKVNRGVVYWSGNDKYDSRVFYNVGSRVYAIASESGKVIREFGRGGYIDLAQDLDREPGTFKPFIANTSPGIIYQDLIILGSRVAESADGAPGHIRAYNVITGEREWIFHTIPHPGETGYDTWPDKEAYKKLGGANSWAGMSLDESRGIVYIPTGSIAGDFYGGVREGENLFANSLVALDAGSGKYLWHYQTVHHDLWDRDLAANPNLATLRKDGKVLDAVAQITKHGYVFLFDRVTGDPVFPIEEKPVSQNALPGEKPWLTQPIPVLPEPFARQKFNQEDVTNLTPETHVEMLRRYHQIKYREMFHPPSREGSWIFPGFDGGGEWGGAAVDPESQILYVNSSELPWAMIMVDVPGKGQNLQADTPGRAVYNKYCFACHGLDRKGNGPSFPSLLQVGSKYKADEIKNILKNGINMMPAFRQIPDHEMDALMAFLREEEKGPVIKVAVAKEPITTRGTGGESILDEVPYQMAGYTRFLDDNGYPGITPPWGTLNAVDLNSGKLLWKVPLGEYPELTAQGHPKTGTENYGGPAVTKGGLIFIAATKDSKIRAFNKETGEEVWSAELPAPGYATPSVYSVNGKQYVVIACGGGKIGSISGDEYVAFALP
ncbi:quinoprotein glucose dehydrogenase [Muriicola jejuensis]|uniref:PQQ-binding-like beta-propeller repeat protein n=2 Tax=Muriicola jejuensis TaxID=504488 RepID=A0A6P0UFD3_9FLAO|nr:PQQ-binding-like beta-propeller repeat protein [Muriicola jejuensis]SMP18618.1 quinoprotein glucose dehydrogenase [Muriicola jejuensis]